MQNRLKSKAVWAALAAQVVATLVMLGVIDTGSGALVDGLLVALLEVLVAFGVLNNPTDGNQF